MCLLFGVGIGCCAVGVCLVYFAAFGVCCAADCDGCG